MNLDFFSRNRKFLVFVLLITVSFSMMGLSSTNVAFDLKTVFFTVIYPFEYLINKVFTFFQSLWKGLEEIETLQAELVRTQLRLKRYEELGSSIDALQRRNSHLESLLEEREQVRYEHVLANIVGKDPQNFYQSFIIDKGRGEGIAERMAVVAYEEGKLGVVGQVVATTPSASLVVTIRSLRSYVGSILETSRYYGLVRGNGMAAHCLVEYIDIDAPARDGDAVLTSGQSDIYPSGLSIGKLTNVFKNRGQFFLRAELVPTVNFARLENVYVIKKLPSGDIEALEREQTKL